MTDLTQQLATRADAAELDVPPAGGTPARRTIADLLEAQRHEIARALPAHLDPDRFARIVLTECRRNPKLMQCTPASLLGALMQAAQLGIEPGPLQQCYLVPYGNEVTFIVGYRGFIDLFRRSGAGATIVAREVCEHDEFSLEYRNDADQLVHVPNLRGRGDPYAYYGLARMADGTQLVHVMTLDEIDRHRQRSKSKDSGPWKTDAVAMSRKTVIRAMAPYLPLSPEVAHALEADEGVYVFKGGSTQLAAEVAAAVSDPTPAAPALSPAAAEPTAAAPPADEPPPPPDDGLADDGLPADPEFHDGNPEDDVPVSGWASLEAATQAHEALAARIGALPDEARDQVRAAAPGWPLAHDDYVAVEQLVNELEARPGGDAASAGPAGTEPDAVVGGAPAPAGPAPSDADPWQKPLADWSLGQLRGELDRIGLAADRRSRSDMTAALRGYGMERGLLRNADGTGVLL